MQMFALFTLLENIPSVRPQGRSLSQMRRLKTASLLTVFVGLLVYCRPTSSYCSANVLKSHVLLSDYLKSLSIKLLYFIVINLKVTEC